MKNGAHFILAGAVAVTASLMLLPHDYAMSLTSEGGLIENLSVGVLACGVICAVLKLLRSRTLVWASISSLFLWMYLRELDYQKLFTARSIESIEFYADANVPLKMKLAAAAALSPFILAAVHLLARSINAVRTARHSTPVWGAPAGFAAFLLGISLVAEKWLPIGFQIVEESAELAFASLLVYVVVHNLFR